MDQHDYRPGEEPRDSLVGEHQGSGSANVPDFDRSSTDGLKNGAEEAINRGLQGAANRIERAASRLDSTVDEKTTGATGKRARAGDMAHSLTDSMDSVAEYLRGSDLEGLKDDLERQVREKPFQTLLIGVVAGWVLGKLVR